MRVIDNSQKRVLLVVSLICIAVIVTVAAIRFKNTELKTTCSTPAFDSAATAGNPIITDTNANYSAIEIPLSDGSCTVLMDQKPVVNNNELDVYFTNTADNTVWLSFIIYDKDGNEVAESGIIKKGEYIKSAVLKRTVTSGQKLNMKVLTYEPDTYYSMGSTSVTITSR